MLTCFYTRKPSGTTFWFDFLPFSAWVPARNEPPATGKKSPRPARRRAGKGGRGTGACSSQGLWLASICSPSARWGTRFIIPDDTPGETQHVGFLTTLSDVIPHPLRVAGECNLLAVLTEPAQEVDQRQEVEEGGAPSLGLIVYAQLRSRDLRGQEDDLGFSRRGEERPPNPAKPFGTILREGPRVGVHTLVWCDTLNNMNRA